MTNEQAGAETSKIVDNEVDGGSDGPTDRRNGRAVDGAAPLDHSEAPGPPPVANRLIHHPTTTSVGAIVLLFVGIVLWIVAAEGERLWSVIGFFAAGLVCMSATLLVVNDFVRELLITKYGRDLPWMVMAWFGGCALAGFGLLILGMLIEQSAVAAPGVVLVAIGIVGVYIWLAAEADASDAEDEAAENGAAPATDEAEAVEEAATDEGSQVVEPAEPGAADSVGVQHWLLGRWSGAAHRSWIGLELIAAGAGVLWVSDGFGLLASAAVVAWLTGLMLLKGAVVPLLEDRAGEIRRVVRLLADATAVAVIVLLGGATSSSKPLVLFGFSGVVVGLSVLGLALMYLRIGPSRATVPLLSGVIGALIGIIWTQQVLNAMALGLVVAVILTAIGAWFVFRGEGIVLILLVGSVIVWGLESNTSSAAVDPNPTADDVIVSLGDSFISGEGADQFLDRTNAVGDDRNECRRSPTAYSYLLATRLDMSLEFFACSGAKTVNIIGETETAPQMPDSPADVAGGRTQLDELRDVVLDAGDVVLLSIGGNDVGFSTIVQACLLPRSCAERDAIWLANVDGVGSKLARTYREIRATVPVDVPIVVVPYPMLVRQNACDLGLDQSEHDFVIEFISELDREIKQAAALTGVHYFEAAESAFEGNLLCSTDAAANHLQLSAPEGDWLARYQPGTWIHNSMHPNELGHRLLADELEPYLADLLEGVTPGEPANPQPAFTPATDPTQEGSEEDVAEAEMLLSDGEWINTELYRTLRRLMWPLLWSLVSGIVLATGVVNRRGWLARMLRPIGTWRDLPSRTELGSP